MTTKPGTLRRPTLLVILDGFGINPDPANNAVVQASTPNFDRYFADYPMTTLEASGRGPLAAVASSDRTWYVSTMPSRTAVFTRIRPCLAQCGQPGRRIDRCI
jgi:hypothetical protein